MKPLREVLKEYYLERVNNYLTTEVFAEHNDIHVNDAKELLELGKIYHENKA